MATQTLSGNDFLLQVLADTEADPPPFLKYLSFGELINERWNTISYDDEAPSQNLAWKSEEGSTLTISQSGKGDDKSGSNKGSAAVNSKNSGITSTRSWNDSWSEQGESYSKNQVIKFTGDADTTEDDYTYRYSDIAKRSAQASSASMIVEFANQDYTYAIAQAGSGNETAYGLTISKFAFTDIQNKIFLALSAKISANQQAEEGSFTINGAKYSTSEFVVATSKFSDTLSLEEFDALPSFTPEVGDFAVISANVVAIGQLFLQGDNTVTITSADGVELNVGSGNDKVTGGAGGDTITLGKGKDTITGGRGDDTFIIAKADYDFTQTKTRMADTITDFKFSETGEQDILELQGFGEIDVFKNLAAARVAKSTAEVIYETSSGKFWYNQDESGALVGVVNFLTVKGLTDAYWANVGI
jgi:Ca2+-binding RTX toxin-like protein